MLKIEHLQKRYGDFCLDCSLEVREGCVVGLIGQNGAGKSSCLKAALGLISADGGNVRMLGKELRDFAPKDREQLGVVLSDSGFSGYLTVADLAPILGGLYRSFDRARFLSEARRLQLPLDKKLRNFSTGMRAKLKLLVAISHDARLLILDEPTLGLDAVARDELLELLRTFMERGGARAILLASHVSGDLERLCDEVYMLHEGRVVLHEDADVLLSDYALLKVDGEQFERMEREHILRFKEESYGYCCLTNQRRYFMENYPNMAVERATIDALITMMARGRAQ